MNNSEQHKKDIKQQFAGADPKPDSIDTKIKDVNPQMSVAEAEAAEAAASKAAQEAATNPDNLPDLVIISGISGGGRTEAMHVFEDMGYFCIDNLPANLLSSVVQVGLDEEDKQKVAVVIDARNGRFFKNLKDELAKLNAANINFRVVFLDASDERLIARYKSSRRRHPMCREGETIAQGIQRERELLFYLSEYAHYVIDTTEMLPQALRQQINAMFNVDNQARGLSIAVYSFGFKNGGAYDADVVIDVRFLPNPYWDPEMRPLSGLDAPVHDFVLGRDETKDFLEKWYSLLDSLIPGYINEGKQQLAIAIGCTGGQHRSVTITESTGKYLKGKGYRVSVAHRDLSMAVAAANGKRQTSLGNFSPAMSGRIPRIAGPQQTGSIPFVTAEVVARPANNADEQNASQQGNGADERIASQQGNDAPRHNASQQGNGEVAQNFDNHGTSPSTDSRNQQ